MPGEAGQCLPGDRPKINAQNGPFWASGILAECPGARLSPPSALLFGVVYSLFWPGVVFSPLALFVYVHGGGCAPPPRGLFSVPWVECLNKPPPPQVGQPRLKIQPGGGHIGRHKGWPLPAAIVRGHMARRGSGWHCLEVMFQLQFRARNAQLGGGHTGAGTGIF